MPCGESSRATAWSKVPATLVSPATTILPSPGWSATAVALSLPPRFTRDHPVPPP